MRPAPEEPAAASGAVLIEFTGSPPEVAGLRALPGVLAVDQAPRDDGGAGGDPGITRVRVAPGVSDAVLRHLLTGGGAVHIHGVRPEMPGEPG